MSLKTADKSKAYIPLAGETTDGWSSETEATATCFCGAVQLKFPTEAPGFVDSFICNCTDCHKITASMFASNFVVRTSHLEHLRGRENVTEYSTTKSIGEYFFLSILAFFLVLPSLFLLPSSLTP